jgi:ferritin-like metal-binding protein YciE
MRKNWHETCKPICSVPPDVADVKRTLNSKKGNLMSNISTLADAFYEELQDMYGAEKQLLKALPKMVKHASSDELKKAFTEHLEQTKYQVRRIEQAFEETGKSVKSKKCEAMAGLIKEAEEMMKEDMEVEVSDAVVVGKAQKVEHYEIATYGTLCTWAKALGYSSAEKLLGQNLDEEEKTDKLLTKMSGRVNAHANA